MEPGPVASHIRSLAATHGIVYQPTALDAFAADVSRLSDAAVEPDEIDDLLVALVRTGVLTPHEGILLQSEYHHQEAP